MRFLAFADAVTLLWQKLEFKHVIPHPLLFGSPVLFGCWVAAKAAIPTMQ